MVESFLFVLRHQETVSTGVLNCLKKRKCVCVINMGGDTK